MIDINKPDVSNPIVEYDGYKYNSLDPEKVKIPRPKIKMNRATILRAQSSMRKFDQSIAQPGSIMMIDEDVRSQKSNAYEYNGNNSNRKIQRDSVAKYEKLNSKLSSMRVSKVSSN